MRPFRGSLEGRFFEYLDKRGPDEEYRAELIALGMNPPF